MRMRRSIPVLAVVAVALTAAGCTYVKLDPAAEDIEILSKERVQ